MILRRPVPASSYIWLKDTVSRKVMDTTRPNLIYHQKNSSLKNFLMAKRTFLKKTQKASLKVLVLERNPLSRQPRLQVKAMMAITTDAEGLLHLLCHHRRNQLHLTTFIAVQLILILTVVVEVAVQVLLKHQASSFPYPYTSLFTLRLLSIGMIQTRISDLRSVRSLPLEGTHKSTPEKDSLVLLILIQIIPKQSY